MGKHHAEYSAFSSDLKEETLSLVVDSYKALADSSFWVLNLANASSLVWHAYHSLNIPVNWVGFYTYNNQRRERLLLGPFQGKVACQTIEVGTGVCGVAAACGETQLVPNVNEFPGHIACDGDTKSEIVIPVNYNGEVIGVLDIDCLDASAFDEVDRRLLEALAHEISNTNDWAFLKSDGK